MPNLTVAMVRAKGPSCPEVPSEIVLYKSFLEELDVGGAEAREQLSKDCWCHICGHPKDVAIPMPASGEGEDEGDEMVMDTVMDAICPLCNLFRHDDCGARASGTEGPVQFFTRMVSMMPDPLIVDVGETYVDGALALLCPWCVELMKHYTLLSS